mmetsp:Transcript_35168/g.85609  ORF Transcript_35168/g.85609 Transcript_35168/m.85609 type:complete len:209 (-) Transcript_35168:310-936(-)
MPGLSHRASPASAAARARCVQQTPCAACHRSPCASHAAGSRPQPSPNPLPPQPKPHSVCQGGPPPRTPLPCPAACAAQWATNTRIWGYTRCLGAKIPLRLVSPLWVRSNPQQQQPPEAVARPPFPFVQSPSGAQQHPQKPAECPPVHRTTSHFAPAPVPRPSGARHPPERQPPSRRHTRQSIWSPSAWHGPTRCCRHLVRATPPTGRA